MVLRGRHSWAGGGAAVAVHSVSAVPHAADDAAGRRTARPIVRPEAQVSPRPGIPWESGSAFRS